MRNLSVEAISRKNKKVDAKAVRSALNQAKSIASPPITGSAYSLSLPFQQDGSIKREKSGKNCGSVEAAVRRVKA